MHFVLREWRAVTDLLRTKIVRGKNISKNRTILVALPVQNHGAGVIFKVCETTFAAYSNRLVAAGSVMSGFRAFLRMKECKQLLLVTVLLTWL